MKHLGLVVVAALCALPCSVLAHAEDTGSFVRLKSGTSFPQLNGDVDHFTPVGLDGIYRLTENWGVGLHLLYLTGSHSIAHLQGVNLALFNLSKREFLPMASGDYFLKLGFARVSIGVKAGPLFYWDRTTLASGTPVPDQTNSTVLFAAGPTLDVDLPIKNAYFANIGFDSMITQTDQAFTSLYVGLGMNL